MSATDDAVRLALLDKLEQELAACCNTAMEASAGCPPAGYDELTGDFLRITDEAWNNGMKAVEVAVRNWIYDQRNAIKPNA